MVLATAGVGGAFHGQQQPQEDEKPLFPFSWQAYAAFGAVGCVGMLFTAVSWCPVATPHHSPLSLGHGAFVTAHRSAHTHPPRKFRSDSKRFTIFHASVLLLDRGVCRVGGGVGAVVCVDAAGGPTGPGGRRRFVPRAWLVRRASRCLPPPLRLVAPRRQRHQHLLCV
jgi:hypothetical protein